MSIDPFADMEIGDDDPIRGFDPDNICGTTAHTSNPHMQAECHREPHPDGWLHVSTCDDRIDYVWRELRSDELAGLILTSEGVVCRVCDCAMTTTDAHFAGCPASVSARSAS